MSELTNQSGDVGNDRLLQQGKAAHDGCKEKSPSRSKNQNETL